MGWRCCVGVLVVAAACWFAAATRVAASRRPPPTQLSRALPLPAPPHLTPQYCDRGSLSEALAERRLLLKSGRPNMVGTPQHPFAMLLPLLCTCVAAGSHPASSPYHTSRALTPLLPPAAAPRQVGVLMCLLDVASGMQYLHSLGIMHGGAPRFLSCIAASHVPDRALPLRLVHASAWGPASAASHPIPRRPAAPQT